MITASAPTRASASLKLPGSTTRTAPSFSRRRQACENFVRRMAILRSGSGGRAEGVGPVSALPGEVGQVPAEVPVRGGLGEDRPEQVEVADDRRRPEVEDLAHRVLDGPHRDGLGAEALDE